MLHNYEFIIVTLLKLEKQYGVLEKQMKTETKDRIELEKLLEEEIKQKQQLEVSLHRVHHTYTMTQP